MINKTCDFCTERRPPAWHPVINVRPRTHADGTPYTGPSAPGIISAGVCHECKQTLELDDVLNDQGWEQIVARMAMAGFVKPDRELSHLSFVRFGEFHDRIPKYAT